jgi:hypothetical protein
MAVTEAFRKNVYIGFIEIKRYGMYLPQKSGPNPSR